jgi:hypothetical protein
MGRGIDGFYTSGSRTKFTADSRFMKYTLQIYCVVLIYRVRRYEILDNLLIDREFLDGTSPRIYPWNQSKISNLKSQIE